MAGGASNYLELKLLDHVFGKTNAYTAPTTLYVALYKVAPTDTGGGTEVTGGAYARVAVTNNTTNFPNAASGSKSNGTAITFPTATADWGTVVAWGILDASSAGNLLWYADLLSSQFVSNGSTPSFSVGDLVATLE